MSDLISTTKDLENFIATIKNAAWIALDTEFIRERTYYAQLCLIQIEAEGKRACIDPLAIKDMSALIDMLNNPDVIKVFHAAHQDLEILMQLTGKIPAPIFDTQVAAAVLGIGDQISYARLVEELLGIGLSKTQSRTDWTQRPLNTEQLEYAIDDVRYLAQVYPKMMEQLNLLGRLDWLTKDFTKAIKPETYAINARERWQKIRGNQVLKRQQLAVLRELAEWREIKAEKSNLPRKWIISDEILIDLAKQQPTNSQQIGKIRGINPDRTKKHHDLWIKLINKGKNLPESEWPEQPRSKKPTSQQNLVIDLLMLVVQIKARENNISPAAIATRKSIAKMIQSGNSHLSDDWRDVLVHQSFTDVLSGKKTVGIENNKAVLSE